MDKTEEEIIDEASKPDAATIIALKRDPANGKLAVAEGGYP